nr:RIKEN cDNA 1700011H14 gene [Mus musculus]
MGLGHSKAHPRVIKVTPLQSQEAETPSTGPVFFALNRNLEEESSFTRLQDQSRTREGQLPPLRETWYGRLPAVSRAMYLDIPLKHEETSIIKRHPPRRIQKLEPIDLPQAITSERLLCHQEGRTKSNTKQENEKKIQLPMYTSGKRQYLHKMKMLEMNHKRQEAQMELRKSLLSKAMLDMQKLKDHNGNKIAQSKPRSNSYDILTILPNENINRDPGNPQDEEFLDCHTENDYYVRKIGKMETWLREQEARGQLFWDSSSSDSDELEKDERRPQALVRTKTEKIPLYDDFYGSA